MASDGEIQRVREHECEVGGHSYDVISVVGSMDPVSVQCTRCGAGWGVRPLKLKVRVTDLIPDGQIFILNEVAANRLNATPFDQIMDILAPERTVLCADEEKADEIRSAAKQIGTIRLADEDS